MAKITFSNVSFVVPEIVPRGYFTIAGDRIHSFELDTEAQVIDGEGATLVPGFVEMHVHGGGGADFMDLTTEAFETVARCHARHGTTTLTPTSTVGTVAQYRRFCALNRELLGQSMGGARFVGGHLYGPNFLPAAKGCHPLGDFLSADELLTLLDELAPSALRTLTLAPELPGSEHLTRAAALRGMLVTAGHTYATYEQMEAAIVWGVRHVDHLFCAMSDRARLRLSQSFPMRAGVMEATIAHDELTTEIIADGVHLDPSLIRFAFRMKGPHRLALVSDSMRAVDCADGEYWFGATATGEKIQKLGQAGLTLDGKSLASSVVGLDHCLRFVVQQCGIALQDAVTMASLTPARILKLPDVGFMPGHRADFVLLDRELQVKQTWVGGVKVYDRDAANPSR